MCVVLTKGWGDLFLLISDGHQWWNSKSLKNIPCWLCETNPSVSGFSGDRKRECGLYTLTGRMLHVETKFVLLRTSGRHDGARAHGNLWSLLPTNNAADRLHCDPKACSPCWDVFAHAENWKSCILSSGFFLLEGTLNLCEEPVICSHATQ